MASLPWEAVVAAVTAVTGFCAWVMKNVYQRYQEDRKKLYEVYGFAFGAEEIGFNFDDDSMEERLERGDERFAIITGNQLEIAETQRDLIEALDVEEVDPANVETGADVRKWNAGD